MKNKNSPIQTVGPRRIPFRAILFLVVGLLGAGYLILKNGIPPFDETRQSNKTEAPIAIPSEHPSGTNTASKANGGKEINAATIFPTKMNVLYIGVLNPFEVNVPGISSNKVGVSISGGEGKISKTVTGNKYHITVMKPTADCVVTVSAGDFSHSQTYRVKRIPDPVARLGNKKDGSMGNGEFKLQKGLIAWLDNFDFDAKCSIQGYQLTKIVQGIPPVTVINQGGSLTEESKRLVMQAKPGDIYLFTNVKARCPGDPAGRNINSLVFSIK